MGAKKIASNSGVQGLTWLIPPIGSDLAFQGCGNFDCGTFGCRSHQCATFEVPPAV